MPLAIPDDVALEKSQIIEALGATVERVRPVSITHKDHYVNFARRRAAEEKELALKPRKVDQIDLEHMNGQTSEEEKHGSIFSSDCKGGFFADQFENLANFRAYYKGTGPEIWEHTSGELDACCSCRHRWHSCWYFQVFSPMNCVGAVRVAQSIGPGHTIVTILCDNRLRHLSKFCNAKYLSQHCLTPLAAGFEFLGVS